MRMSTTTLCAVLTAAGLAQVGAVPAGEPGFAQKPAAQKSGDPSAGSGQGKVTVSFAVSAPTDVAVYVLDAQGRCVRHLVAGVLGGKQPPPEPLIVTGPAAASNNWPAR